jgi:hypothetical protein
VRVLRTRCSNKPSPLAAGARAMTHLSSADHVTLGLARHWVPPVGASICPGLARSDSDTRTGSHAFVRSAFLLHPSLMREPPCFFSTSRRSS